MKLFLATIFLALPLSFLIAHTVSAQASLRLDPERVQVGPQSIVRLHVLLRATESVNIVAGTVKLPEGVLLDHIELGKSIITMWIEKPAMSEEGIVFSGMAPGGFVGSGVVMTLYLAPQVTGGYPIEFEDIEVLLHDGLGTTADIDIGSATVTVSTEFEQVVQYQQDNVTPEEFELTISRDKNIFDGAWFAVWNAVDKQSGIEHYEVLETKHIKRIASSAEPEGGTWIRQESPYMLEDQYRNSYVFVRAFDHEGNYRTAFVRPQSSLRDFVAILALVLVLGYLSYFIHKKKSQ